MIALLSIGANLGDREQALRDACACLDRLPGARLLRVSPIYQTRAVGVDGDQPDYLNCAAEIEYDRSPDMLLGCCLGIESAYGRVRTGVKAPRVLDIDLLMCSGGGDTLRTASPELILPHPRMLERAFVLVPLRDLYPDCVVQGVDIRPALERTGDQVIERYGEI